MKRNLRTIFLAMALLLPLFIHGQGTFAPVGAEWWYHNTASPLFPPPPGEPLATEARYRYHSRSIADTIVHGILCRKVTTDFRVKFNAPSNSGFFFGAVKDFFFYDNTDTVFIFNQNFGRFTPLYILNAQEGDTICLPVLPTPNPDLRVNPLSGDTSFCFVVDSVRVLTYDTAHLRTFYTRALSEEMNGGIFSTSYPAYNWGGIYDGSPGVYIERIGGPYFFPTHVLYCGDCFDIPYGPYGSLACYSDTDYNIHLRTSIPCDSLLNPKPLGINDQELAYDNLRLYPVPAITKCTLTFINPLSAAATIQLSDITGRSVGKSEMKGGQKELNINTTKLPAGLYLLQIRKDNAIGYGKLIVGH